MQNISKELEDFIKLTNSFRYNYELKKINWFQVGGKADLLFKPKDHKELQTFLKLKGDMPIFVMGVGSNVIIRDQGFRGCVIRLGKAFTQKEILDKGQILVGAANLDLNIAIFCKNHALANSEFLSGIPGTIGGAIKMNAGAYDREVADILVKACGYDLNGNYYEFTNEEMSYQYRRSNPPIDLIYTHAVLQLQVGEQKDIAQKITEIQSRRESTQPIRSKTGGSTFKNPENYKAWQLIDKAGCRGLKIGGAMMSEQHCNFMINQENAKANDLEELGNIVKAKVKKITGVNLEWEIKIIGKKNE